MSRRPDVIPAAPAPAATVVNSTTGTKSSVWENPKVKVAAMLLVAVVAGVFLYRTIRKRQVKKDSRAQSKEEEVQQWQTNFESAAPRPRPQPRAPSHVHPGVTARTMPRRQSAPNANNQAQMPPADVGVAGSPMQMRAESTRPVREEGFSELPKPDINPNQTTTPPAREPPVPPTDAVKKDGFTEV